MIILFIRILASLGKKQDSTRVESSRVESSSKSGLETRLDGQSNKIV